MKKTKLFGSIAILVVLTLSGCDAILEAFYPEFGQNFGGDGGNNIRVFVEVIPGNDTVDPQIAVLVENLQTDEIQQIQAVWPFWNWNENGDLFLTANVELFNIPDGEYRVVAWLERTTGENAYNGFPDFDEPQREAEWYPPGATDPTNFFQFPLEGGGNFIAAEAFLEVFEGAAADHDFNMTGQRVLNITEINRSTTADTRYYDLFPLDTDLTIEELDFTLWGPGGQEASGYVDVVPGDTASFSIDYSFATADYYWLDVSVRLSDDWWEYKGFPIRILSDEATVSFNYTADVLIFATPDWPLDLGDGAEVNYTYNVVDASGGSSGGGGTVTVANEEILFQTGSLSYDPTTYGDGVDGVDILRIEIDHDQDGEDDYYTEIPLGVSTLDVLTGDIVPFYAWAGDFRPYFRP